jgi:hypothetical protein
MCIPRVDPALNLVDPLCPLTNRYDAKGNPLMSIQFGAPPVAAGLPDPLTMAPLAVGDYITFNGQQVGSTFEISSLEANVNLLTAPGTQPAYMAVEAVQIGITSPATGNFAIAESKATIFTTDPGATIGWFVQDVDPCTGVITERLVNDLQSSDNAAPPVGRAVFRLGKILLTPSTRNVVFRMVSGSVPTNTVGNITAGVYVQPVFDFVFPELTVPGAPFAANAFDVMPFLALGSGPYVPGNLLTPPLATPPIIGQLSPWPGVPIPAPTSCPPPPPPTTPTTTPVTPTTLITTTAPAATPTPPPDTIVINSAVSSKARQGSFQLDVTATTNSLTAKLFLSVAGSNPVPNPLSNAPMTSLGNGKWSLSAQIKGVPLSVTVTSDIGGKAGPKNV